MPAILPEGTGYEHCIDVPPLGGVQYFLYKITPTPAGLSPKNHKQFWLIRLGLARNGVKYSGAWPSNLTGAISISGDDRTRDLVVVIVVLIQFGHELGIRLPGDFFNRIRRGVAGIGPTFESRDHHPCRTRSPPRQGRSVLR